MYQNKQELSIYSRVNKRKHLLITRYGKNLVLKIYISGIVTVRIQPSPGLVCTSTTPL